ncbi:hypothetical protein CKAH01_10319 [Colletotrichum kahawae]|uniref:Uncharacterized protein n=1 Tax=Colletotrichum kahawae TaxID=34407 RepID=A0AAD9XW16_COLKA|nr:hypothetical protein CKAH01_10319 [Colletotrichum kahawae]
MSFAIQADGAGDNREGRQQGRTTRETTTGKDDNREGRQQGRTTTGKDDKRDGNKDGNNHSKDQKDDGGE